MAHQRSVSGSVSALPNFLPFATSVRGRALGSTIAKRSMRFVLHALAVSLIALSAAVPGFAATDTVTSLADDGSAGTLRSVIAAAAPGDTITFSVNGTITLTSGQLELSQNLTISGPGAANLAISGNNASTVFQVDPQVTAAISGLTIENGNGGYASAGAILNDGTLTVSSSTLSGNSSYYFGAILNEGTLTLSNSNLSGNSSSYYVGGIFNDGTLTVSNSTLSGNSSYYAGGIWMNQGTLTLSNSTLSGNSGHFAAGIFSAGAITLKNTLLAGQASGGNCDLFRGSATSDGYNLSDDSSCGFLTQTGDQNNTPAGLDPKGLQNNGGPTQTIALLATSSAVDAIPTGACSDAFGSLVSTDQRGITRPQGSGCDIGAFELAQVPTANVCPAGQTTPAPCNYTITLQYNIPPGTTFGASPVQVVTQGAPNLDFTLASTTCAGSASSCIVQVTFAPLAPGVRMGAVQLTDNLGNVLATTMIHGIGQGPAITFGPGVQTTVPTTGLANPYGLALDGAGDIFIADPSNQRVVKVPAGGGPQTTVGSGLSKPFKVTVDGAGNVFIGDIGLNQVVKVPAGGGPQTTVGTGLNLAYGVAVDGAGNVFIADSGNNRIVEVPADGSPQITVGSGLTDPIAVAVDAAGNLFVADRTGFPHRVVKIPADGGQQTIVVGGLNNPTGVAVDAAGDVFVADFDGDRILEVPAGGGAPTTVGNGMYYPFDMALDGVGNVFIMDWGNSRVLEVQRSQPPAMSFAPTADGSTSSDSPQSVTIQNIGNQPLNAIAPGLIVGGPDFVQVAGPGTPADCTSSFSLTPGASCDLSISFTPSGIALTQATGGFRSATGGGDVTAAATFTDNALNTIPSASQSIVLQGKRLGTQTITFTQNAPAQAAYNSSFNVAATGGASGNPVTFTSAGACSNVGATYTMTSGAGTCSVIANQAGDGNYAAAPAVTETVAAVVASQTIAFNQNAPAAAAYNSSFNVTATGGASGNPVVFTSSGSCSNVGATYTMTSGAGTCSVIANQLGNTNYSAAPQVTETVNATQASQSITFTQSAPSFAPYNGSFTVAATASSGLPVTFGSLGVCTNAGATFTMTNSKGTCTVTASQSGNANYLAAPSVQQTTTAAKAAPTVNFTGAPATAPYQSTFTVTATTNSGITPTIAAAGSCSLSGTTVTMTSGTGTCTMTAKWATNNYYLATTVAQTTTAEKLVSAVNWTGPTAITYGTALSGTQLNATASVAGNFVYSPAAGVIPKAGTDILTVTFTPTLNKDYTTVTAGVVIQVGRATPIVTWAPPAAVSYGTALSATQLDASANVAGKFAYSPAAGKVLTAGTKTLSVTFTPTDSTDYTKVTTTVTLVVNKVGTSTAITSDLPNPSATGQAVSVHFTVIPATNYTAPTGSVTVNASTGESCSATFSGGSGSCTMKFNTAGARTLTATYGGDSNNSSSISAAVTQTVN